LLDLIDFLELVRLMGMVDFLGIPSGKCVWKVKPASNKKPRSLITAGYCS
jgi:hypothetical protein